MKGRILLLLGVGIIVPTTAYFAMGGELPLPLSKNIEADPEGYSMVFNASKRLTESELASSVPTELTANTANGNPIYFTYVNMVKGGEGAFQTFAPGGYLQNSFKHELDFDNRIGGIKEISYSASDTSSLKVYFGDRYLDGIKWDNGTLLNGSNDSKITLASVKEYFKIVNITNNTTASLNNLTLQYSCADSEGGLTSLFKYVLDSDHYYVDYPSSITLPKATNLDIDIPSSYEGKPVTVIRASCFNGYYNLWNCYIPDSITTIQANSFNSCTGLKYLYIPSSVASISAYAFASSNLNAYFEREEEDLPDWPSNWDSGLASKHFGATRYNLPVA